MQYANPNAFMDNGAMPPQMMQQPGYGAPQPGYDMTSSNGQYRQFFEAGDFNRAGFLVAGGLQTAMNAAGEQIDFETAQVLMQTADQDGNGRVDYNGKISFFRSDVTRSDHTTEFADLLDSVREVKSSYNGGAEGMASRDIESYVSNKYVFSFSQDHVLKSSSSEGTERGLLPTLMPTNQKFFTFGNFIKLAFVVGIGRKIYDHKQKNRIQNGKHCRIVVELHHLRKNRYSRSRYQHNGSPIRRTEATYGCCPWLWR